MVGMEGLIKCTWLELGLSARFQPIDDNRSFYEWFLGICPTKAIQSHAVISGQLIYILSLPVPKEAQVNRPIEYEDMESHDLMVTPAGYMWTFATHGKVASIMVKYGPMTEPMSYPAFARVVDEDLDTLVEAGHLIWNAIYRSKQIITCEFTAI